jgi:hypothetical protein
MRTIQALSILLASTFPISMSAGDYSQVSYYYDGRCTQDAVDPNPPGDGECYNHQWNGM